RDAGGAVLVEFRDAADRQAERREGAQFSSHFDKVTAPGNRSRVSSLDRFALLAAGLLSLGLSAGALGAGDRPVELLHRAQPETDRVARLDVLVPVGPVAYRGDRRLGRADQLGDLP